MKNPNPPVRDFLAEMEAEPVKRDNSKFWNELFQALTYEEDLGSVFGVEYEQILWAWSPAMEEWKEQLLRFGIEWQDPERTYKELCYIKSLASEYLPAPSLETLSLL